MLKRMQEIHAVIEGSRAHGWVLEPDAKKVFSLAGLDVPRFAVGRTAEESVRLAGDIGYPVVTKVVSPKVIHKSDVKGVVVGIADDRCLVETFRRFSVMDGFVGMLIEEMVAGIELIAGAKVDFQFGPMVLLGMGGTGVEIYKDVSLRMAPVTEAEVPGMVADLRAHRLLTGYRGADPIDMARLASSMAAFSNLVVELETEIESIDINPLLCSAQRCVVADARIMLK
ncbi:MAG: acetate--CoA ligase family protein [Desulfobacterota bacterium]|nr:acetate--CoA ligase family protein [Thermodesulfobacteriota bacterium]